MQALATAGRAKTEQAARCRAMLGPGSSTRGSLHCIAAHEVPRSLAMRGGGLARGGGTASRSGPSHGRLGYLLCSPILVKHGSANSSVKRSQLLWFPTRHVVSPRAAHSAPGIVTVGCQKHSRIASRPPCLGVYREGITGHTASFSCRFEYRALSLRPRAGRGHFCLGG